MDNKKLERWAQQLLDTGKRNNLINFKDTKASTAEVVYPDAETLYQKCLGSSSFEIYDPKISDNEDDEEAVVSANAIEDHEADADKMKKSEYIEKYSSKIRKANQILVYANTPNPITAIKTIDKKARDVLEETGVNVAYMAFGFVYWSEKENSSLSNRAPLLLVPISLKNESAVTPYYVELTEDDVVVNPTFSYLLEAQYGIKLPEYEDDETLAVYLEKVRSLVSKLHWEVKSECKISIFSFLKINMYHDLMNNSEKILKNDNVRLLLGEKVEVSESGNAVEDGKAANQIIDLHNVIDADSSQIEAIEMAKSGRSFVLQGPPGTGKSQTITNIIAECLHDGKKVLFVSEKLAALSVVYDKLKKAGLEEFCLELHSYKSSKKEVIAELCKTLRAEKSRVSAQADVEVKAKAIAQSKLDSYAEELHKPVDGINRSLYQLLGAYSSQRKALELKFLLRDIGDKDDVYFNEAVNLLEQYVEYIPSIGENYRENEWFGYRSQDSTYETQNRLKNDFESILDGLTALVPKTKECEAEYSLELNTLSEVETLIKLFTVLSSTKYLKPASLKSENIGNILGGIEELRSLGTQILPIRDRLNETFEDSIYKLDGKDYYNKLTKLYTGFFSRLFNAEYKSMISDIRLASKSGKKPGYEKAQGYMKDLMDYQELMESFNEKRNSVGEKLSQDSLNPDTDWQLLRTELEIVKYCLENDIRIGDIADMPDGTFESSRPKFGYYANNMAGAVNSFKPMLLDVQKDFDENTVLFEAFPILQLFTRMQRCKSSVEKIENWIRFNTLLEQMKDRDLVGFIDYVIENRIPSEQIVGSFKRLFYKQWINHILNQNVVLSRFTRISQDMAVQQFAQKDKLQFEISKAQIKAELSAKRPSTDLVTGGSAVAILLREGEKKRKQKSIRKLLEETGELVQRIKPCFLMSPLSVSTFLSDNSITFDTVVFDEASQIFPQDAIGAIYRAKQLIVVGDSKQMPPSNFFNSTVESDTEDEETGDVTDFESILDLCSTSQAQLRLKWHYRSRYEQLITFSNKNFYDNALVTFPSSTIDHKGIGVDYYFVDGLFDRKSHTNRAEAEFIVDLIYKNIEEYPERSLGVVAFSVAQQDLIDRILSKRRQEDSSKEWFFKRDDTTKEPFFVKNLETVQGDERDTIIFSVAYGKDSQGRLLHNFGPLNKVGGERRLNVAVTRAKENVQLVSSMHATDIDLKRTNAEGARLLREYLDYAENGDIALERTPTVNPFEQFDSEFEMDVCEFLRENGFSVDMQVGCSGFRIDIGLKKPDTSDYVLAIECDGATYHSSKNARDRDRLRQEVLERMGWRFYRIWSTDWFRNNAVEKERLLKAAREALNLGHYVKNDEADEEENVVSFERTVQQEHLSFPEYKEVNVDLLRTTHRNNLEFIKSILETEAPMSEEYLLKRICFIYGREKVTSVVRQQFTEDLKGCFSKGIIRRNGYLYLSSQNSYQFRVPGDVRDIRYIAPEELAEGMIILVKQNVSAEKDGLYRTLASLLGFSRIGEGINEKMEEALNYLLLNRIVTVDNNVISMK